MGLPGEERLCDCPRFLTKIGGKLGGLVSCDCDRDQLRLCLPTQQGVDALTTKALGAAAADFSEGFCSFRRLLRNTIAGLLLQHPQAATKPLQAHPVPPTISGLTPTPPHPLPRLPPF